MVGTLDRGTFYKEVTKSIHLFRKLDAWGIDAKTLHSLPVGTRIRIHDIEDDVIYTTTKEVFMENKQYFHFKEESQDHMAQVFLPREFFTTEKPKPLTKDEQDRAEYMKTMGLPV